MPSPAVPQPKLRGPSVPSWVKSQLITILLALLSLPASYLLPLPSPVSLLAFCSCLEKDNFLKQGSWPYFRDLTRDFGHHKTSAVLFCVTQRTTVEGQNENFPPPSHTYGLHFHMTNSFQVHRRKTDSSVMWNTQKSNLINLKENPSFNASVGWFFSASRTQSSDLSQIHKWHWACSFLSLCPPSQYPNKDKVC